MLILIEGVDGSGKSTLAANLAKRTGGRIIKTAEPTADCLVYYTAPLMDYRAGSGETIIIDRFHLGEKVYGPIRRGKSGLSPVKWGAVEAFLAERGAIGVLCFCPLEDVFSRLRKRGEPVNEEQLTNEARAFQYAWTWSTLPWFMAHTTVHSSDRIADAVVDFARREEERALA
jgi:thymidylate kinase